MDQKVSGSFVIMGCGPVLIAFERVRMNNCNTINYVGMIEECCASKESQKENKDAD